jgi:DNA polymerase-3 subunit alpha
MKNYVSLHNHDTYSIKDGLYYPKDYINHVKLNGMTAFAQTNHGTMAGVFDFYDTAKKLEIKPILGMEGYFVEDKLIKEKEKENKYHIILLAKNYNGYKSLLKATYNAAKYGFYNKPRIDWTDLNEMKGNVICTSACSSGIIAKNLNNEKKLDEYINKLINIFGKDDFYFEYLALHRQNYYGPMWKRMYEISKKYNLKSVISGDVHYIHKSDYKLQQILHNISNKITLSEIKEKEATGKGKGWIMEDKDLYLKTYDEILEIMKPTFDTKLSMEFLDNTLEIANKVEVYDIYPKTFAFPKSNITEDEMKNKIKSNLKKKVILTEENKNIYQDRIKYEWGIIKKMGFVPYFAIVTDIIDWVKKNTVPVGLGRGCLTPNSMIKVENGIKEINKVNIGEKVISDDGLYHKVNNKFEYDVSEEVVGFKHKYQDLFDIPYYTQDHKILCVKNKLLKTYTRGDKVYNIKTSAIGSEYNKIVFNPQYIEAKNIEIGDFLCVPITKIESKDFESFDLFKFNEHDYNEIGEDFIIEKHSANKDISGTKRWIHKKTKISRNAINDVLNTKKSKLNTIKIIEDELKKQNINSIEEWKEILTKNKYNNYKIVRYLKCDGDFLKILGLYISDGYSRKDGSGIGLAFHSENNVEQINFVVKYFKEIGIATTLAPHKKKKLVQIYIKSRIITSFFNSIVNKYAINKNIDEHIKMLPNEKLQYLIEGLMLGDGHIKKMVHDKSCYDSINLNLILDLREIFFRMGIPCGIAKRKANGTTLIHDSFKLTIATNDLVGYRKNYMFYKDKKYMYIPVIKIFKKQYSGKVYDLEIENNHSFRTSNYVVHNSAAGSLISYLLDITEIDSVKYGLSFERFLNPTRCLTPNTKVITHNGLKKIEEVKIGDKVKSLSGKFNKVTNTLTTKVNEKILKIKYDGGNIKCTKNHKWIVMREGKIIEVMADKILLTDKLIRGHNEKL